MEAVGRGMGSRRLRIIAAVLLGGIAGLGGFTFVYARGFSYFSKDPLACVNCHVMREMYEGWVRGSHRSVATCSDCHTPHESAIAAYAVKGLNGLRHSYAFTTGEFPEPIRIRALNAGVTRRACLFCHGDLAGGMAHSPDGQASDCLTCHAGVGHDG